MIGIEIRAMPRATHAHYFASDAERSVCGRAVRASTVACPPGRLFPCVDCVRLKSEADADARATLGPRAGLGLAWPDDERRRAIPVLRAIYVAARRAWFVIGRGGRSGIAKNFKRARELAMHGFEWSAEWRST